MRLSLAYAEDDDFSVRLVRDCDESSTGAEMSQEIGRLFSAVLEHAAMGEGVYPLNVIAHMVVNERDEEGSGPGEFTDAWNMMKEGARRYLAAFNVD